MTPPRGAWKQSTSSSADVDSFLAGIASFSEFGNQTIVEEILVSGGSIPVFRNEFWTSRQRAASSLHEVSYRACFKPQLPRFFAERLSQPGDLIYDPFMGRGTTVLEAALLGRRIAGCDVNPLSRALVEPRLRPPLLEAVEERVHRLCAGVRTGTVPEDLLVFYHPETLSAICSLRDTLLGTTELEWIDAWIRMVAVNRLTGHSPGFFSVYTLPPNQAASVESQKRINSKRNQVPPLRDLPTLIARKTRSLLSDLSLPDRSRLQQAADSAILMTGLSSHTPELESNSVALVVTSPPFLDIVDYAADNWLRCWFLGVDPQTVPITKLRKIEDWQNAMQAVFVELERVLRPGGFVAFEVGEVRHGQVKLEDFVLPVGSAVGLEPVCVLINQQEFTKTANCWGVKNGSAGTNTNRIVVFRKP